ncbi:hypothetical protein Ahy_A03g016617 [Arachis hypogaea]|uniref:RING-type domain-containing protein n=1 Tax=Arachis hypogaea TaxID=3818 RepID=A0A445E3V2_ARAHY|nr:uncharacterized protein LOC112769387 [Arachis hypogaea]RYR70100.1 hypothetical protein Ahy_A03g016617 [Arachis hypogaea]
MTISKMLKSKLRFRPQRKNNNANAINIGINENKVNDKEEMKPLPPTCSICTLPVSVGKVFNNNNDRCIHSFYYCHNCISRYFVYRARFFTAQNISCPDLNCTVNQIDTLSDLVINECKNKPVRRVECPNCKKEFRFKCQILWHHNKSCYDYGLHSNDVKFAKLVRKK